MSHDEAREVGAIDEISVDVLGRVVIVATVTDGMAMRMPALSISARIGGFTIRNPDSPAFVGEITSVTDVNECSLTSTSSNRHCLVLERWIPSPYELSSQAVIDQARRLQAMVQALAAKGAFARAA